MVALTRDDGSLTLRADCAANLANQFAETARWTEHEAARRCC
jgi:hypothetical protein